MDPDTMKPSASAAPAIGFIIHQPLFAEVRSLLPFGLPSMGNAHLSPIDWDTCRNPGMGIDGRNGR